MSNTKTIAKNSGWYGSETVLSGVVALVSSIAINRYLGPSKNHYIVFISYIAYVVGSLGSVGIPATTRKYMSEFLGMGNRSTARYIFFRTLFLQATFATIATGAFLYWVLGDAGADYKLAASLLVLSIWPSMVNEISAQANAATEDLSTNFPASAISALAYFFSIVATVVFHWGVVGVGASLLLMRTTDFLVRLFPTVKRVLTWETTTAHPAGLRARMIAFAWPSIASMALSLIVWGRSEVILLEKLCADKRQVSFYSLAFTMAEQLLLAATIFGTAAAATIFVQYGRDKSRLPVITASTFRYLALISIPLHFVAASLAVPALSILYGPKFADAALVVTLAPALCIFKAFLTPAQSLLQSSERQSYVIGATVVAGIVDIGVAWYLIPAHGAVGASIGNGAAQALAVIIMWAAAIRLYKIKLPWVQLAKIVFISTLASLSAHAITLLLPPLAALPVGGLAAVTVVASLFYLLRVLEPEDHGRLKILADMLPRQIVKPASRVLSMLTWPELSVAPTARATHTVPTDTGRISPMITKAYRRHLPEPVRHRILDMRKGASGIALRMKLVPIKVDACLRGGDNGVTSATFARMIGDIRRASMPIAEWPHVKLLRKYEEVGERVWEPGVLEQTDYYKNALLNIDLFGRYFDAFSADQIHWGARRFVNAYAGPDASYGSLDIPNYERDPYEYIAVSPIKYSKCFSVVEGHHRLALAHMQGMREVKGLILQPALTTPVQDLLLDVMWLKGRRELYQPIDSPEVTGWVLVRRCKDRFQKMINLLEAEGLMPPVASSYLDIACSYGWFVDAMQKAGFAAHGVERDPIAISVGQIMYGLNKGVVRRSDAVNFLKNLEDKFDVTSCFSLAHHFILNDLNVSAEQLLGLVDAVTKYVMFFDMGQEHEYPGAKLRGWEPDRIHRWLEQNTTFSRIERLGPDEDSVYPNQRNFGRMLFACIR